MTQFTYSATTITMEVDPLHPRTWEESQEYASGYNSDGTAYAYDCGAPIFRTETLTFNAISWSNLQLLAGFIENTIGGSSTLFSWIDRGVTRSARYKALTYQQVSPAFWRAALTLEVVL